ncbi:hypothetical protein GCM10017714_23210 [Curtobacterium pusillum]|nr:hypothetical protein GCM10017610_27380 [Curtobacterium pusillum]
MVIPIWFCDGKVSATTNALGRPAIPDRQSIDDSRSVLHSQEARCGDPQIGRRRPGGRHPIATIGA